MRQEDEMANNEGSTFSDEEISRRLDSNPELLEKFASGQAEILGDIFAAVLATEVKEVSVRQLA